MKKSYKKLMLYELIMLIILILIISLPIKNDMYAVPFFLIIALTVIKHLLGFEKDRHRYIKDTIIEIFYTLLIYYILYYLLGILIGFAKTDNYYTLEGLFKFILPCILTITLREYLRYTVLTKSEGSKTLIIMSTIFFIMIDVFQPLYYKTITDKYDLFLFIALTILPIISTNLSATYITYKVGYKPVIFFLLFINLINYIMPIIPNPNYYIASILQLILPVIIAYRIYLFFDHDIDKDVDEEHPKVEKISMAFSTLLVIVLVYFISGYFHFHAIVIASGSMEPNIYRGDIVIIEKKRKNEELKDLKIGQPIAYKRNGIIVVHRLIKKVKYDKNKYYYYTKGDANLQPDNFPIEEDMIIGKVNIRLPYIGLPTVWLNEL